MPTKIALSYAAQLLNSRQDTIRKSVREKGSYKGVTFTKDEASGEYQALLEDVLRALPQCDLSEPEREALDALQACTGELLMCECSRAGVLGVIHSVPFDQRHDAARLVGQVDVARRVIAAIDRSELFTVVDHGDHTTALSAAALTDIATALDGLVEYSEGLSSRLKARAAALGVA